MTATRRELIAGGVAIAMLGGSASAAQPGEQAMYGLIGKMTAKPGQRDALVVWLF